MERLIFSFHDFFFVSRYRRSESEKVRSSERKKNLKKKTGVKKKLYSNASNYSMTEKKKNRKAN